MIVVGSAIAVAAFPAAVLLLGPLFLGVPHVLAELRVFARRVRAPTWMLLAIASPLALLIMWRVAEVLGLDRPANSDVMLGCIALCLVAVLRSGNARDRIGRGLIAAGLSIVALQDPKLTTLLLAHAHNFVALVFLGLWMRNETDKQAVRVIMVTAAVTGCALTFLATPTDAGFVREIRFALAPALDPVWGTRLVLIYALAQLLHYAAWLWWIPALARESAKPRSAPRRTRSTMLIVSIFLLPLAASGFSDPASVRDTYLALSGFHGWLELCVLAFIGLRAHAH